MNDRLILDELLKAHKAMGAWERKWEAEHKEVMALRQRLSLEREECAESINQDLAREISKLRNEVLELRARAQETGNVRELKARILELESQNKILREDRK